MTMQGLDCCRTGRPAGGGGWRARLSPAQAWAAVDVGHALEHWACAASAGLRAVDAGRLVVDGGPLPSARLGGGGCGIMAEQGRWSDYRGAVRAREMKRALVRGRRSSLYLDVLLVRVVVEGRSPASLDAELGVREGRCQQAVLAELNAYAAMHADARLWEIPA